MNLENLAQQLIDGDINLAQWQTEMRQMIRIVHREATAVAMGGMENVTPAIWGYEGSLVKKQYQFLDNFAADIAAFSLMGPQIISFGLFGTALANLHRVIAISKVPHQLLAIFVISLLTAITANLLTFLRVQPTTPDIYTLFGTALYSALLGPLLFLPTAWWMRIKKYRFGK